MWNQFLPLLCFTLGAVPSFPWLITFCSVTLSVRNKLQAAHTAKVKFYSKLCFKISFTNLCMGVCARAGTHSCAHMETRRWASGLLELGGLLFAGLLTCYVRAGIWTAVLMIAQQVCLMAEPFLQPHKGILNILFHLVSFPLDCLHSCHIIDPWNCTCHPFPNPGAH